MAVLIFFIGGFFGAILVPVYSLVFRKLQPMVAVLIGTALSILTCSVIWWVLETWELNFGSIV